MPIHELPKGWGSFSFSANFVRWMKRHAGAYDCVIVHGIWDFCALGTWWALRDSIVPYFVVTHGMLDPWFKNHQPVKHFLRWFYWPWGGYPVLRDSHAVFFQCDDERNRAQETFWLYDCHEFVVRSGAPGIPPTLVEGAANAFLSTHPTLSGKRLFTVFSDYNPIEGIHALAGAVDTLSKRGLWSGESMRLVIANPSDQAVQGVVEEITSRCGISGSVYWAGSLTEDEKWGALRASEIFLRLSSYEICGNRIIDALSAGTPVLTSTGVAIWKDIVNDGAGLSDEGTQEGCARMLKRWIGLPAEDKAAMRIRARRCF